MTHFNNKHQTQFVDIIKFEKFSMCLQNMFKVDKAFDFVLLFLE